MADDDPETTAVGDMGKRLGLLGGQDQILRLGAGKGCIAVADVIVIAARCSRCSTSSKSRVVKRSPPRLPLRHRVGCPAHGAQHRVELARTFAVTVYASGHVAAGEGRLLPGEHVER